MICGIGIENNKNDLSKLGISLLFVITFYEVSWFSISSYFQLFIKVFKILFNNYKYTLVQKLNNNYIDYIYLLHIIIIYIVIKLILIIL